MKLNFTIELPCKDHENCYNLEVDGEQQVMSYEVQGQPQLANGVTTINLGNVTQTPSYNPNIPASKFQKIIITEQFTRQVAKQTQDPEPAFKAQEAQELEEFFDKINKQYNELAFKHNEVVDQNNDLRKLASDLKHELRMKHPDPADTIEYKKLLQEFESFKEIQELKMKQMKEKVDDKQRNNNLDVTIREQKFMDLERDIREKDEIIKMLKQEQIDFEPKLQKLKEENEDLEKMLDSKYEHFEEMNKYINQLLMEKKDNLANIEQKEREIKELDYELKKQKQNQNKGEIYQYPDQVEVHQTQTSTNYPTGISDGKKITKTETVITTTTKTRKVRKIRKKPDGSEEVYYEDEPVEEDPKRHYMGYIIQEINPNDDQEKIDLKEALKQAQLERDEMRKGDTFQINDQDNFNERKLKRELKNALEEIDGLRDELKKKNSQPSKIIRETSLLKEGQSQQQPLEEQMQDVPIDVLNELQSLREENELLKRKPQSANFMVINTEQSPSDDPEKWELKQALKNAQEEIDQQRRNPEQLSVNDNDSFNERKLKRELQNALEEISHYKQENEKLKKQPTQTKTIREYIHTETTTNRTVKQYPKFGEINQKTYDDMLEEIERLRQENYKLATEGTTVVPKSNFSYDKNDSQQITELKETLRKMEKENENLKAQLTKPTGNEDEMKQQMKKNLENSYNQISELKRKLLQLQNERENSDQEELTRAYDRINELQDQNDTIMNQLMTLKTERDKLLEQLKQGGTGQNSKTEIAKETHTTTIRVQKDKIKLWQQSVEEATQLTYLMKQTLEDYQGQTIYDQIDQVVDEEKIASYATALTRLNEKDKKYMNQIKLQLDEKKELEEQLRDLRKKLKDASGPSLDQETLQSIFSKIQGGSEQLIELQKLSGPGQAVNFQKVQVESDDPQMYVDGMNLYFDQQNKSYPQIRDNIIKMQQEINRLTKFEKEIKSGKNKDYVMDDYKNIASKIEDLKIKLEQTENLIDEDNKTTAKRPMPQTADVVLQMIEEDLFTCNKKNQNLKLFIEDLQEEIKTLKKKLKDSLANKSDFNQAQLNQILTNEHTHIIKLIDIHARMDPFKTNHISETMVESNDPNDVMKQVAEKQERSQQELLKLEAILNNQKDEINLLKDYERQVKSGQDKGGSISDLNYVLNRNKFLYNSACSAMESVSGQKPQMKTFEPAEQNSEAYLNSVKLCVSETNLLIEDLVNQFNKKKEEQKNHETLIKELKAAQKQNYTGIFDLSKKNLKGMHNLFEKYRPEDFAHDVWKSQVFDQNSEDSQLQGVQRNMSAEASYQRKIEDILQRQQEEIQQLQKFKKDVESGKNKEASLKDYQKLLQNMQNVNEQAKENQSKVSGETQKPLALFVNKNDAEAMMDGMEKLYQDTLETMQATKNDLIKKEMKYAELEKLEKDVLSGKNKQGAAEDFKKLWEERKKQTAGLSELIEEYDGKGSHPQFVYNSSPSKPEHYLADLEKSNKYLVDAIQKLKNRVVNQQDQNKKLQEQMTKKNSDYDNLDDQYIKLKSQMEEMTITMKQKEGEGVTLQQMKQLFEMIAENNGSLSVLHDRARNLKDMPPTKISTDYQSLLQMWTSMCDVATQNKKKIEAITLLMGKMGGMDEGELLKIAQKVDELKMNFLQMYEVFYEGVDGDQSGIDLSKAKGEEQLKQTIFGNISYIKSLFDEFEEYEVERHRNVVKTKDEALRKKEQLQVLVDDLQNEVNKKTTLIGRLQVKIYMLISILEHKELMSKTP